MIWLVGEMWPWLLLAMALGAALSVAVTTRTVRTERWVEEFREGPEERASILEVINAATTSPAATAPAATRTAVSSPFPEFRGDPARPRPWEEEEHWSQPVRRAATHAMRPTADQQCDDAAEDWQGRDTVSEPVVDEFAGTNVFSFAQPVEAARSYDDDFPHAEPVDLGTVSRPTAAAG